jgi:hypothetical protein
VISEVFEQLLADPRLAEPHRVSDQHAIVAGEDAAGFLDGILLELGEIDGATGKLGGMLAELVLEVLVQGLGPELVDAILDDLVTADREVGRRDVERPADALLQ